MKTKIMAALTLVLFLNIPVEAQAEVRIPAVYVALGDSLAAGQTPDRTIDAGYADMIAQELSRQQPVAFYTKNLAFPGFATANVLDRVTSEEAADVLKQANIITISAGANDLLPLVQMDPRDGSLTFNQIQADYALNGARENMEQILAELTERAPDAAIYVMGYYFPYPHARDIQKEGTIRQLDRLNAILEKTARSAGATFVPLAERFGTDATDKLPNTSDVHPNFSGYQAMANAFFDHYQPAWQVTDAELPAPNPMTFDQIQQQQAQQQQSQVPDRATAIRPSETTPADYLALAKPIIYT